MYQFPVQVKVLKATKTLSLDDVVLGQYVADPDGKSDDARMSYLDDPTVPKGAIVLQFLVFFLLLMSLFFRMNATNQGKSPCSHCKNRPIYHHSDYADEVVSGLIHRTIKLQVFLMRKFNPLRH